MLFARVLTEPRREPRLYRRIMCSAGGVIAIQ